MKSNLFKRAITGVLFVAVLIASITYSPITFVGLFALISAYTTYELTGLLNNTKIVTVNRLITSLGSLYLFIAFAGYSSSLVSLDVFIPYLGIILYLFISELYLKHNNPIGNLATIAFSQFYIGLFLGLINLLVFTPSYQPIMALALFIFIWVSDSGAYCVGSLIGKVKLFPRISPNKSWEGSIGGAVFSVIAAVILAYFYTEHSYIVWIGFALITTLFGTWGDLTESLIKRQLKIKDSGNILPGHGGFLDRFDSTILAIPAIVLYFYVIETFL